MKDLIKKIITSLICIFVIIIINFILPRLMPGDPVLMLTGQEGDAVSQAQYQMYREKLGVDDPINVQFRAYLKDLFHGDLGYSYHYNDTVINLIKDRIPNTLQLAFPALIFSTFLAVYIGSGIAYKKNARIDHLVTTGMIILNSVPGFLLAMTIVTLFAFRFRWFPLGGLNSIFVPSDFFGAILDRLKHLVLPVTAITLSALPAKYLMVRNIVHEARNEKYVIYAQARGLSEKRIKFIHIFKNISQPFIALVGLNFGYLISGSMIVEVIFSINGMGGLIYEAAIFRDYPTLRGCLFVVAITVIAANIITDVVSVFVDPRQRYGVFDE